MAEFVNNSDTITRYENVLENSLSKLNTLKQTYSDSISTANTHIASITFDTWQDDFQTAFLNRKEQLTEEMRKIENSVNSEHLPVLISKLEIFKSKLSELRNSNSTYYEYNEKVNHLQNSQSDNENGSGVHNSSGGQTHGGGGRRFGDDEDLNTCITKRNNAKSKSESLTADINRLITEISSITFEIALSDNSSATASSSESAGDEITETFTIPSSVKGDPEGMTVDLEEGTIETWYEETIDGITRETWALYDLEGNLIEQESDMYNENRTPLGRETIEIDSDGEKTIKLELTSAGLEIYSNDEINSHSQVIADLTTEAKRNQGQSRENHNVWNATITIEYDENGLLSEYEYSVRYDNGFSVDYEKSYDYRGLPLWEEFSYYAPAISGNHSESLNVYYDGDGNPSHEEGSMTYKRYGSSAKEYR